MKLLAPLSDGSYAAYCPDTDTIAINDRKPFPAKHANSELCFLFNLPDRTETVLPFYPGRNSSGERY